LARLAEHVEAGHVGSLSPRFYGVPTDYSQAEIIDFEAERTVRETAARSEQQQAEMLSLAELQAIDELYRRISDAEVAGSMDTAERHAIAALCAALSDDASARLARPLDG
jgi:hypothetical protein